MCNTRQNYNLHTRVCACLLADLVKNEVFPPLLLEGTVVLHRNVVRGDADMERVLLGPTLHVTVRAQVMPTCRHIVNQHIIFLP